MKNHAWIARVVSGGALKYYTYNIRMVTSVARTSTAMCSLDA